MGWILVVRGGVGQLCRYLFEGSSLYWVIRREEQIYLQSSTPGSMLDRKGVADGGVNSLAVRLEEGGPA
jgi:hypothetical protein